MIVAQIYSWWPYHFLLLVMPVGLLGGTRTRSSARSSPSPEPTSTGPCARQRRIGRSCGLLPGLIDWSLKAGKFLTAARNVEWSDAGAYRRADQHRPTAKSLEIAAFLLATDAKPGTVYIMGSPLYLTLTGRRAAIPMNGVVLGQAHPESARAACE
jgi:hypothetical protein